MKKGLSRILALCLALALIMCVPTDKAHAFECVYIGGIPLGIELKADGVVVVAKTQVTAGDGVCYPLAKADVEQGDLIVEANGKKLYTAAQLTEVAKSAKEVELKLLRAGKTIRARVRPAFDVGSNCMKLGLLVKDNVQGIGTLTFMREDGGFAALGHPVSTENSRSPLKISGGVTRDCVIMGTKKGGKNTAGELKGVLVSGGALSGVIKQNDGFGLFGRFDKKVINESYPTPVAVATVAEVKTGAATLVTTIEGAESREYAIEIVTKENQQTAAEKGMVVKIVDEELLEKTGGILQGMSGSPILQNGKLVGAVTHVMLSDAKYGYAIFAEFMLARAAKSASGTMLPEADTLLTGGGLCDIIK